MNDGMITVMIREAFLALLEDVTAMKLKDPNLGSRLPSS